MNVKHLLIINLNIFKYWILNILISINGWKCSLLIGFYLLLSPFFVENILILEILIKVINTYENNKFIPIS